MSHNSPTSAPESGPRPSGPPQTHTAPRGIRDQIAQALYEWSVRHTAGGARFMAERERAEKAERERDYLLDGLPESPQWHVKLFDDESPCTDWCPACLTARAEQAEAAVQRVRDLAQQLAALSPADEWAGNPFNTHAADIGRRFLLALDPKDTP